MRVPQLHRHRASRRGFIRVAGLGTKYFEGEWPDGAKRPPPAIEAQYKAAVAEWVLKQQAPGDAAAAPRGKLRKPSVSEVWERYDERNQTWFRKAGTLTSEVNTIRQACRVVDRLFGTTPAAEFGPQQLLAVRAEYVQMGWCRSNINDQVSRVRSMFKWAAKVEQGLVPMSVYHSLTEIDPLRRGRCNVRESPKVRPVAWDLVERSLPHLGAMVQHIVRVHWLLGCRSQDVVGMRPCDLRQQGQVWEYRPGGYKTEHHEQLAPVVYCPGPRAQEILRPLLDHCGEPESWVFPCRANRGAHGRYTTGSYRYHVTRRLAAAGLPRWVPLQLKHARLTLIREKYGAEAAQLVANHQHLDTTLIYAEPEIARVKEIMREIG